MGDVVHMQVKPCRATVCDFEPPHGTTSPSEKPNDIHTFLTCVLHRCLRLHKQKPNTQWMADCTYR